MRNETMRKNLFLGFAGMFLGLCFATTASALLPASAARKTMQAATPPPVSVSPSVTKTLSLTPDLENGAEIFGVCTACHMPGGPGTVDGTYPRLAGQHKEEVIKQIFDFREGHRVNMMMLPFAQSLVSEQEVADVAAYIQSISTQAANGVGPGTALERGAQIYKENCVSCHGDNGEGNGEKFYPKLTGQHYPYVLRQVNEIADGKRGNADPTMLKIVQGLSTEDKEAVSDYVSRLKGAETAAK